MKSVADHKRRDLEFKEGDFVYLRLQPYHQKSLANRPYAKLSPKYYGPYRVSQRIGQVAYHLEYPPHSLMHLVFHVSLLKPALGTFSEVRDLLEQLTSDLELVASPEAVLGVRT